LVDTDGWAELRRRTMEFCPGNLQAALARAFERVETLPSRRVHGDFEPKNLLLGANGRLGVLDWEFLRCDGIPGRDLILLSVLARTGRPDPAIVVQLAQGGEPPWGALQPYLHRSGLPDDALRPTLLLLLVLWAAHEKGRLSTPGHVARVALYEELLSRCAPYLV
jgi:hypothetical protein